MAKPKFPLRMDDGSEVRTLEELREHADLATIAARYDDGTLRRWLGCWNFIEEAEKVEQLDSEAEGFHKALYDVLGIPWTEETDVQLAAYADAEIERELAAQREQEVQEVQAEPEEEIPEPGNALARPSMDDAMCDEVARLLNYRSDRFEFVETDDYVFFNSESSGKDGKWAVFSKAEGRSVNFITLTADMTLVPESAEKDDSWAILTRRVLTAGESIFPLTKTSDMRAYGNQVVIDNKRGSLSLLDLEGREIRDLQKGEETFQRILTDVVCDCMACDEKDGLWLYNLKDGARTQITAHGETIKTTKALLTESALFFVCKESKGWLDDGENPNGCICRYDLSTGKSKVLAKLKIGNFGSWHLGFNNGSLYICGVGVGNGIEYYYCDISADTPSEAVQFKLFSAGLRAEHYLEDGEKFCGKGIFSFQDGFVFLGGSEKKLYLCFLDFATGEMKTFTMVDIEARVANRQTPFSRILSGVFPSSQTEKNVGPNEKSLELERIKSGTCFRLENWFYYSIKADSDTNAPRECWKISLETGEQVKLSCGD